MAPRKAARAAPALAKRDPHSVSFPDVTESDPSPTGRAGQATVIEIAKSHASRLRVSLTEWRGRSSIELRETTATIPGAFWPTAAGVTLAIDRLPELIRALQSLRTAAENINPRLASVILLKLSRRCELVS